MLKIHFSSLESHQSRKKSQQFKSAFLCKIAHPWYVLVNSHYLDFHLIGFSMQGVCILTNEKELGS